MTEEKYKKKIGKYTIIADTPPSLKGYSTPEGKSLTKDELWHESTFYEQDYFAIYILNNLHVIDETGAICTPIITEIEIENSGYVCTWASTFWVQGFAILNDEIYFISIGSDEEYYSKKRQFNKIKLNTANAVDSKTFIETMIEPINLEIEVNLNLNDWWSGEKNLRDCMLLSL